MRTSYEIKDMEWSKRRRESIPSQEPSFQKKVSPQDQAPMPSLATFTSEPPKDTFSSSGFKVMLEASDTIANGDDDDNRRVVVERGGRRLRRSRGDVDVLLLWKEWPPREVQVV